MNLTNTEYKHWTEWYKAQGHMYDSEVEAYDAWQQIWHRHNVVSETDPLPTIGRDKALEDAYVESAALYTLLEEDDEYDSEYDSVDEYIDELPLTNKQKEVLRHKSAGLTNAQIAEIVGVTERAVEMRLANIRERMGGDHE